MANRFEKGKHIFFLFKNGYTVQDSQLKPRYYLELDRAKQYLPYGDEIIEYAPVRHGRWIDHMVRDWRCSECGEKINKVRKVDGYCYDDKPNYCPNCGAKMDKEERR